MAPIRQYVIGALIALALVAIALGASWGRKQYLAGQMSHTQALASAQVLFQAADKDFTIKDVSGVERPATVAEVLLTVARERVANEKERIQQIQQQQAQQQSRPPVPVGSPDAKQSKKK